MLVKNMKQMKFVQSFHILNNKGLDMFARNLHMICNQWIYPNKEGCLRRKCNDLLCFNMPSILSNFVR